LIHRLETAGTDYGAIRGHAETLPQATLRVLARAALACRASAAAKLAVAAELVVVR
jgi:hypothetical protein